MRFSAGWWESFGRKQLLMNVVLLTSYGFFVWHDALFAPLLQSPSQPNYDHVELSVISITETED